MKRVGDVMEEREEIETPVRSSERQNVCWFNQITFLYGYYQESSWEVRQISPLYKK